MMGNPINHADTSGCTACCAIITQDNIYVGNLGDSRAVLAVENPRKEGEMLAVDMSIDMKPDLESEKKRIEQAGGQVIMGRVDGMLALSAAIGDKQYKKNS